MTSFRWYNSFLILCLFLYWTIHTNHSEIFLSEFYWHFMLSILHALRHYFSLHSQRIPYQGHYSSLLFCCWQLPNQPETAPIALFCFQGLSVSQPALSLCRLSPSASLYCP